MRLWEKLEQERKKEKEGKDNVVQMEDAEGNVMPERIYYEYVFLPFICSMQSMLTCVQSSKARYPVIWHPVSLCTNFATA
jgi:hypothetical protein